MIEGDSSKLLAIDGNSEAHIGKSTDNVMPIGSNIFTKVEEVYCFNVDKGTDDKEPKVIGGKVVDECITWSKEKGLGLRAIGDGLVLGITVEGLDKSWEELI